MVGKADLRSFFNRFCQVCSLDSPAEVTRPDQDCCATVTFANGQQQLSDDLLYMCIVYFRIVETAKTALSTRLQNYTLCSFINVLK